MWWYTPWTTIDWSVWNEKLYAIGATFLVRAIHELNKLRDRLLNLLNSKCPLLQTINFFAKTCARADMRSTQSLHFMLCLYLKVILMSTILAWEMLIKGPCNVLFALLLMIDMIQMNSPEDHKAEPERTSSYRRRWGNPANPPRILDDSALEIDHAQQRHLKPSRPEKDRVSFQSCSPCVLVFTYRSIEHQITPFSSCTTCQIRDCRALSDNLDKASVEREGQLETYISCIICKNHICRVWQLTKFQDTAIIERRSALACCLASTATSSNRNCSFVCAMAPSAMLGILVYFKQSVKLEWWHCTDWTVLNAEIEVIRWRETTISEHRSLA